MLEKTSSKHGKWNTNKNKRGFVQENCNKDNGNNLSTSNVLDGATLCYCCGLNVVAGSANFCSFRKIFRKFVILHLAEHCNDRSKRREINVLYEICEIALSQTVVNCGYERQSSEGKWNVKYNRIYNNRCWSISILDRALNFR